MRILLVLPFVLASAANAATGPRLDPIVKQVVAGISEARIGATMKKLASFGTRGNMTDPSRNDRGIGAARRWMRDELTGYSPRLQVSFDEWHVKKQGERIVRDMDLVNVVAVLPGTTNASERLIVSAHYDTINMTAKPGFEDYRSRTSIAGMIDFEKSIDADAPGATDDASGVALVMELARVMSQFQFEKTIVFIAFAGEEFGEIGARLYADRAKKDGDHIEAVFNNDIVGTANPVAGSPLNSRVNLYSPDPPDSKGRSVARYIREAALHYVPEFRVSIVLRADRLGRGGDHAAFTADGFAAVRFTTTSEDLIYQHSAGDTFEKTSPAYTSRVARVNAAAVASLALAPAPPDIFEEITAGENKGRLTASLNRGSTLKDAVLKWKDTKPADDLAGYVIVTRSTLSPYWEHETPAGKVTGYTLRNFDVDTAVIGVKAVDKNGNESLVSSWSTPAPNPTRPPTPIELMEPAAAKP